MTGLGVVAPTGVGAEEYWTRTLQGVSGIGPISRFDASPYPVRLAGEVRDLDVTDRLSGRILSQTDRLTQIALVAADLALADAGLDTRRLDPYDIGVVTANSVGGFEFGQHELSNLWANGPEYVSAYQSFAWFYAVNTGQISIRHGIRGPNGVIVAEQAGGLDAVGQARRHVGHGTRAVVSGGVEAPLCPWSLAAHLPSGRLSREEDPASAYRPFTRGAPGHVLGEGGAILLVEDANSAWERGVPHVYGEVAGHCSTFDPPPSAGRGPRLEAAMRGAIADAGLDPADVDVVFADAAGVPELDLAEARAVTAIFGPRGVPVTAPKTMVGRLNAGGGALDLAAALLCVRDGLIPPTVNVDGPAGEYDIDLVTRARPASVGTALVCARGYGGFNSAMVVREFR
ncbi:ketosynthase chain-length factor [Actinomadura harenae]|uniref:ketosynthase chain-length factor n=1 Tax=Actinomadura harenae TaxID=2483351 RepID=UPI002D786B22|nr:ketosynthase chain-length factor [Actinomadura harenae]